MGINTKVAFIGCGNMGGALAKSAAQSGCLLMFADADLSKAQALADALGGKTYTNLECAAEAEFIFMAVKPQIIAAVLAEMAPVLLSRKTPFVIVSMAAGVEIAAIHKYIGGKVPTIRIMPNTPASVGGGVILYCTRETTEVQTIEFCRLMQGAGMLDPLPEELIDAGSALSGCGPAFVYQFIEALALAAESCGLPKEKALMYAEHTVAGAARLAIQSGEQPQKLKDAVCSPGGSTIEGVRVFENQGLYRLVGNAVTASYNRTKELGK